MAQGTFKDLAGKFGKSGGPPGLGLGLKVLAVGAAAAYGISQSMYTGEFIKLEKYGGAVNSVYCLIRVMCYFG